MTLKTPQKKHKLAWFLTPGVHPNHCYYRGEYVKVNAKMIPKAFKYRTQVMQTQWFMKLNEAINQGLCHRIKPVTITEYDSSGEL